MKNNPLHKFLVNLFFFYIFTPVTVLAYIGPGLGLGAIGIVLGIIASVLLALFAIFWYPIKRYIKKLRGNKADEDDDEDDDDDDD